MRRLLYVAAALVFLAGEVAAGDDADNLAGPGQRHMVEAAVPHQAQGFDRRPYLRLRIKCYVYDHRFEPRIQSDITARASGEFLKRGIMQQWRTAPGNDGSSG
jgi:hypothetical protein